MSRKKRIVIITGVSGGIGNSTAKIFSKNGWIVVGTDRRKMKQRSYIDHFINADISKPEQVEDIFLEVKNKFKQINALVNNAAIQICKPLLKTTLDDWDAVMDSNIRSVYLSIKYAYPLLRKNKGSIVNIGSIHAISTTIGIAAYAASKGALLALTRAVALEFGKDNIRVNVVLPGAVDTPMLHEGLSRRNEESNKADLEILIRGLGKKHILRRVGTPKEIGMSIYFLADNSQSSFITGQSLIVDGGATSRLSTE